MSWLAVAVISIFGAYLRFYHLTFPALWNDETLVFWRVCGRYGQMLVPLKLDGFPPLHYSLFWIVGHPLPLDAYVNQRILGTLVGLVALVVFASTTWNAAKAVHRKSTPVAVVGLVVSLVLFCALSVALGWAVSHSSTALFFPSRWTPGQEKLKLTPWVMRAIPAVFGAVTVPAIYFLARQMLPRGTSLVACAFTACSAFMLFYSRDGKMYSDSWMFVTLNLGCLLWWFRTGRATAWLGWIAAGCAMVGLQATANAIPAISVLLLLTQRYFSWKKMGMFVVGLGLIYAGPIGYYAKFNLWTERVEDVGWSTSGLGWVGGFFNGDRTGVEHYQYATSAFLMGWEYPRDDYVDNDASRPIPDSLITGPETVFAEMLVILALGLLPWPLTLRPRRDLDVPPESGWRVYLWIAGIILPVSYGMYCFSVTGFVSPWRWWFNVRETLGWPGLTLAGAVAVTFVVFNALHPRRWPAIARFVQYSLVTAALFGICLAVFKFWALPGAAEAFFQGKPWQSIWTPRYLGTLWPVCCLGVAALLMRLPTRAVRIACVTFMLVVNLGMFGLRMTLGTEPPIDIQAHDEWLAQDVNGKLSTVHTFDYIVHGGIAVAETTLDPNNQKVTAGRYYLMNDSDGQIINDPEHRPLSPNVFERSLSYFGRGGIGFNLRQEYNAWQVKRDIVASPQLERVIIWTRIGPRNDDREEAEMRKPTALRVQHMDHDYVLQSASAIGYDPMRRWFPAGWKLGTENVYTVHNPWDWRTFAFWIRREYVKTAAPAVPAKAGA